MTPQNPKRHTQAEIDTAEGRDLNHHVTTWGDPKPGTPTWKVTCRRRISLGSLTVEVRAPTAEAAKERVRAGEVPAIGLGWIPMSAVLKT